MKKKWVIPDIHGYLNTLKALIEEQIRPTHQDELYFLGDYIDRGPDSRGVIDYIRTLQKEEYSVTALKGNHEDFVVELYDAEMQSKNSWFRRMVDGKRKAWYATGGKATLKSFGIHHLKEMAPDYISWMRGLEYYVKLDQFILVHAGLNCTIDDPFTDTRSMLWLRDYQILPEKTGNRKIIHGHVPVDLPFIDLTLKNSFYNFIDLDNGPYLSGKLGYGNLVALELTNMEIVIQDNRDS
ncbi:MAG: metallophosphoesterase [Bacteroidetes bacterium]|nr:metallophosphoesterase [Bacteroidota bacterium]